MISSPLWSNIQHVRWQCSDRNTLSISLKLAGSYYSMGVKPCCWTSFGSYHASFWSEWITVVTDDWTGVYTAWLFNFFQRFTLQINCSKAQIIWHWKLSSVSFKKNPQLAPLWKQQNCRWKNLHITRYLGILFWLWSSSLQYLHKKEMVSDCLLDIKCRYGSCFPLHHIAKEHF